MCVCVYVYVCLCVCVCVCVCKDVRRWIENSKNTNTDGLQQLGAQFDVFEQAHQNDRRESAREDLILE